MIEDEVGNYQIRLTTDPSQSWVLRRRKEGKPRKHQM